MRNAIFFTAYNRISYLQQTLYSWDSVRGKNRWHWVFRIEPSPIQHQIEEEFAEFVARNDIQDYEIITNVAVLGVLHHPWVGFQELFAKEYDFVVRAEDDLVVSEDILEFFEFVSRNFRGDDQIATAHAFTHSNGPENELHLSEGFSPWLWGTWRNRWLDLIGPTWDHNYSTFNVRPGNQSGWDWNLNTRIFPQYDLRSVVPAVTRANNIGVVGTHGTAENFVASEHFRSSRGALDFTLSR